MSYPYQDSSLPTEERVSDLLGRLPMERKAAMMFQTILSARDIDMDSVPLWKSPSGRQLLERGLNHLNLMGKFDTVKEYAEFYNLAQKIAMDQPYGVPLTLSSDPRHAFRELAGHSMSAGVLSAWPEQMGMVAIRDPERMYQFADIVRQEYIALGFRAALHPQADLSTEYRWSRIIGGLGEDAKLAGKLVAAHIRGLQGEKFGKGSVTACVKHFPGGGPASEGLDPHFVWGSKQIYPGDNFDYHLEPFRKAVEAGTRVMMPSYGKPMGTKYEEVAMAYNKGIIGDLLQGEMGYEGVVLADWCVLSDLPGKETVGDLADAKAWGVEHLTREERIIRALEAGVDQFGGEYCEDVLIKLVKDGKVSEERIDKSARKLLKDKFELGLFDNPYVDVQAAEKIVGCAEFKATGLQAQKDSLTLIKNQVLPLKKGSKVYIEGFKGDIPSEYGNTVSSPSEADFAILRLKAPYETMGKGAFARNYHHGSLEYPQEELDRIAELSKQTKVILDIFADRPLVLGSLNDHAAAIILNYGASDEAVLSVLFGDSTPKGKLPFDLPRSNEAVAKSRTDVPFDTEDAVYRFGHGLTY